jgi:hypothetical protein
MYALPGWPKVAIPGKAKIFEVKPKGLIRYDRSALSIILHTQKFSAPLFKCLFRRNNQQHDQVNQHT